MVLTSKIASSIDMTDSKVISAFEAINALTKKGNAKNICLSAEYISKTLNQGLVPYGLYFDVTADKSCVYVDEFIFKSIKTFVADEKKTVLTLLPAQVGPLKKALTILKNKDIRLIRQLHGAKRSYFKFKQIGFGYMNLHSLWAVKTESAVGVINSVNGAATLTPSGIIAMSFVGGSFFQLAENFVPYGPVKTFFKTAKHIISVPAVISEFTFNQVLGILDKVLFKEVLPINITSVLGVTEGPTVEEINYFTNFFMNNMEDKK